jgi:lactoylglutathione lyase
MGLGKPSMIEACHHIGIAVKDFTESRRFYGDVLELEELPRPPELEKLVRGVWFKLGPTELHLFERADRVPRCSATGHHLAFRTSDFDGICQRIKDAEIEFVSPPGLAPDGIHRAFVNDPSGNLIEINDGALQPFTAS